MKGMILAAGFGTRMLPVTRFVPKALLPVAGRPLLEWNLRHLAAHGVEEAVVNAHHLAAEMRRWEESLAGRAEEGLPRVRLIVETEILGTGGGIANAATELDSDPVVVVNADQFFRPDLAAARATHETGRFLATLLCVRDPRHAQVRADGLRATAIESRPVFGDPELLTFTGVYFLAHEAVEAIVVAAGCSGNRRGTVDPGAASGIGGGGIERREDCGHGAANSRRPRWGVSPLRGPSPLRGAHFLDIISLFRAWMAERRLGVHLVENEPFLEAGSPEAYLELLREATPILRPLSSPVVHGFGFVARGAVVAHNAWIEESAVLDGAIVEPEARVVRSILGSGAVARGEVARCIVADGESRTIGLLPRGDEEALIRTISRTEPTLAGPCLSIRLLQGDGSTRRIVRAVRGAQSRILVLPAAPDPSADSIYPRRDGPAIPDEAATFAYLAEHLERLGVPVPHIYALDAESRVLLLEDLGDTLVYDQVLASGVSAPGGGPDGDATFPGGSVAALRGTYEEALEILRRMQAQPSEPFDPARTSNPDYDEEFILRFEAGYFLREMVRGHCRIEPTDSAGLEADCARAAHEALSGAPRVFMHRDYQSRNLMRAPRGLVVIDFQGARLGPPEYDLAALVLDPYADLPENLRVDLVERFLDNATRAPGERTAARHRFRACGINRMLQALGAFGYLGGRLGKPGFLEHAPAALLRLGALAKNEYPHLEALSGRVYRAVVGSV
jgi:hypothetical protein